MQARAQEKGEQQCAIRSSSRIKCQSLPDPNGPVALKTPRPATEPRNGPTRNFHEKYRKNTPRPEILDSQNLPPKYPENTEKIPRKYRKCVFLVFFRYFGGIFLGFQNFGPGGIFLVFFVEIAGRAILGLCSRSGRS